MGSEFKQGTLFMDHPDMDDHHEHQDGRHVKMQRAINALRNAKGTADRLQKCLNLGITLQMLDQMYGDDCGVMGRSSTTYLKTFGEWLAGAVEDDIIPMATEAMEGRAETYQEARRNIQRIRAATRLPFKRHTA